ncbi:MAG: thioredoxin family protein [Polyangiaceae bacterium]
MAYAWAVPLRSSRSRRVLALVPVLLLPLWACGHGANHGASKASAITSASPDASAASASLAPPTFLRYPGQAGAIEPWVQEQVEIAEAEHLRVLVYVGASWCEPCQRFHAAVQKGELNGSLNGLRFLEFDQDRDAGALKVAGYSYEYIPVLALPDPDGRNHGRMVSGSLRGPKAVKEYLVPRLQALLAGQVVD